MVNIGETVGGRLLAELSRYIEVGNDLLPEHLHSKRGYRTLESIKRLARIQEEKISQHKIDKATKARNIARLAAFHAENPESEFDYSGNEKNHDMLYRCQMAMVGGMVRAGLIDADELDEE